MFLVRLRFPSRLSLLQVIRNRYGDTIVKLVCKFEKVDFKHRKAALDLNFFQTCGSLNVIPKFLQFHVANKNFQRSQAYQKFLNHLLLTEINNKNKNLKVLVNELSLVKSNLLCILHFLDFNHVCNIIISNNKKSILKCKYTHKKKLSDLIPGYEVNLTRFSHEPNKVIFNFSSYVLTEDEKVYFKGLWFCVPPKKIEYADFHTQFELLYRDTIIFEMKSENRNFLKKQIKKIVVSLL